MEKTEKIKRIGMKIIPVLKRHKVTKAGIFGSFARGDMKRGSDVDVLVKFKGRKSLFEFVALKLELEKSLKRKVDLAEYSVVHPLLKGRIMKEQVRII